MSPHTLQDYEQAIKETGRLARLTGRTLVAQCLWHDERNPSMQVFEDGWTACYAGCERRHIGAAFAQFRDPNYQSSTHEPVRRLAIETQPTYQTFDLAADHARLPLIPRDHSFKGLPLEVLDDLGWRYDESKGGYFIPYFNRPRTKIPFAQWRHLSGPRRFTFLPGAKPTLYGKWNISVASRLFLVEGTSDAAVLQHCMVPWVALPSASSGSILTAFAKHAQQLNIDLIYAGDNDEAGNALKRTLDKAAIAYRICQPPAKYKDWGDFFEAEGSDAVFSHCVPKLFE